MSEVSGQLGNRDFSTKCYGFGYTPDRWDIKDLDVNNLNGYDTKPLIQTAYLIRKENKLRWIAKQIYNLIINGYVEERRPLHFEVYKKDNCWVKIDAWREV